MNMKVRILLSVVSVITILSLCSCGKQETAVSTTQTTGIWENSPEAVQFSTQPETTYKSCEEPFVYAYNAMAKEIADENGSLTGVYIDKSGNSLSIESYTDSDGYINFFVCKFKDGKTIKLTINSKMKKFTKNNNLLIDKNSDILVLRYYVDKETIRQIIYNYDNGDFIAVRDKKYGYDDTESMDTALKEYAGEEMNLISFSDNMIKDNIDSYVKDNLSTTAAK